MTESQNFNPNSDDERPDGNVRRIDVSGFINKQPPSESKPSTFVPPEDLMVNRTTPKDNEEPNPKFFPQTFDKSEIQRAIEEMDREKAKAAESSNLSLWQKFRDRFTGK